MVLLPPTEARSLLRDVLEQKGANRTLILPLAGSIEISQKLIKRYGSPTVIVTDRLRSYSAAMKVIGNVDKQEVGRWKNNRAENSHLPFRRRERAMLRFRRMRSLQKFVSVHSFIHNHFNQERHLYSRDNSKLNRSAVLSE